MTTTINASTSAGLVQTADTSGVLALQTANTTAVSINSSQIVTLTNALPVASGGTGVTTSTGTGANVLGTSPTITTPIVATTMGVGGATPSGSGSGISFPATQSASSDANTLDDYEEGTWTPVFSSGGGSITGGSKHGSYTKVGNLVSIQIFIGGTFTVSSPSGGLTITGFPFASLATNPNGLPAFGTACYSMNAGAYAISVEMASSSSTAYIFNFANGSRSDASTYINANTQILIGGTYRTTT